MITGPGDGAIGFWETVRLLLGAARARADGRRRRQQEILNNRSRKSADWSGVGLVFTVLLGAAVNVLAAYTVTISVDSAQSLEVERQGKIVVDDWFLSRVREMENLTGFRVEVAQNAVESYYASEAKQIAERRGGTKSEVEKMLRGEVRTNGSRNLVGRQQAAHGVRGMLDSGPIAAAAGSLVFFWWLAMLVCQGEGLELDLQRRRHPMWEWLFSHPVRPGAVFLAEMLSPLAANSMYWSAPLFIGVLYGIVYGFFSGVAACVLIGVPVAVSAACAGKALEIAAVLRLSPRSRGAALGIMSWFGYASMMLFLFAISIVPRLVSTAGRALAALGTLPWPWLAWLLGGNAGGSYSFLRGALFCWCGAGCVAAAAVWFSTWGANRGLSGNFAAEAPSAPGKRPAKFGRDPLYHKEFLWFMRDRSAVVQAILIPLTLAAFQAINLRGVLNYAQGRWSSLCGAGIFFGTFFLWVLGPKSLASEGSALWIALTWPRGLESLLKAKARLWSTISTGLVALVLGYACFVFPHQIWKVALVGVGWFFFSISMAEKAVTLVTVTPESGEAQKVPSARRWAAQLGMLTFAIGIVTEQWHLAVMGIVYSYITAAAMWENFRARLPYLYDPWSERVPPPPTLMHAMITISILVECGAVVSGIIYAIAGQDSAAAAQAISYGICAVAVFAGTSSFLRNRDVPARQIWCWPRKEASQQDFGTWFERYISGSARSVGWLGVGAGAGLALGLFASLYVFVLQYIPGAAEVIHKSQQEMARIPNLRVCYAIMAIGFAPFAEEYLFRGLLFRALDREWGGWRAVVGGAAFFAIYHPPLAWLPVGLLGAANCLLFKRSGRLAPAVILHIIYNAVVVS